MEGSFYRSSRDKADKLVETIKGYDNMQWFYKRDKPRDEGGELLPVLSKKEQDLEEIMKIYRRYFRTEYQSSICPYIAARPFYSVKSAIESDPLFTEVFSIMPKGGLLHVHSSAALSIEGYWQLLQDWNALHRGDPDHPADTEGDVRSIYVFTQDYIEGSVMKARAGTLYYLGTLKLLPKEVFSFVQPLTVYIEKDKYPDPEYQWEDLKKKLTFTEETEGYPYAWEALNEMFARIDDLFNDREFYKRYHIRFFLECLQDGIKYVEMRCGFTKFAPQKEDGIRNPPILHPDYSFEDHFLIKELAMGLGADTDFIKVIQGAVTDANTEWATAKYQDFRTRYGNEGLQVKLILNVRRNLDPGTQETLILDRIGTAIKSKPYGVIGFDFVSEEDRGRPTSDYWEYIYGNIGEAEGKIDFYLHDGESLWADNDNIIYAAVACHYRIGHGFNMASHPGVANGIALQGTADGYSRTPQAKLPMLEICPISNQLLRYFPDLRAHTAYQLMKSGVMCVLGNDDPLMFGNPGLSYDFWMAYVGMGLDFSSIKQLVFNSLMPLGNYGDKEPAGLGGFKEKWDDFVSAAHSALEAKLEHNNT